MIRIFDVVILKKKRSISGVTERQNYVRVHYGTGDVIFTKDGGRGLHRKVYNVNAISFFVSAEDAELCQGTNFAGPIEAKKVLKFVSRAEKESFVRLVTGLELFEGRAYSMFQQLDTKHCGQFDVAEINTTPLGRVLGSVFSGRVDFEQFLATLVAVQSEGESKASSESLVQAAEAYENERYSGWVWCKLSESWTNHAGTERKRKDLDFEDYEWLPDSVWKIDLAVRDDAAPDKDGWLYSSAFAGAKWTPKMGFSSSVRRRRWVREGRRVSGGRFHGGSPQLLAFLQAVHDQDSAQMASELSLLEGEKAYSPLWTTLLPSGKPQPGKTSLYPCLNGTLIMTNYRILFLDARANRRDLSIPLGTLERIEVQDNREQAHKIICLMTKDYRYERFLVNDSSPRAGELPLLVLALNKLAFPGDIRQTFAFKHRQHVDPAQNGYHFYDPPSEFKRMGFEKQNKFGNQSFRICYANLPNYALCPTYPSNFIVPENVSDEVLAKVAAYRSAARIPATVYIDPRTGATMSRCAQPLAGVMSKRCVEDIFLIRCLREANPTNSKLIYFVDLRPYASAVGNALLGKGTESAEHYAATRILFMNIDNIHEVRYSMEKLMKLCHEDEDTETSFTQRLEESKWLTHVRCILEAAVRLVGILEEEAASMVVHCSDGWDRTSQVTSLVKLMMDPYYRTRRGFAILVEQEWLAFGHKFGERYGQAENNYLNDQRAPVFLQWLDCVWQITRQFPLSFEFSENYLTALADHVYSCRFGTFLVDTEAQRKSLGIEGTVSVWTYVCSSSRFLNRVFDPELSRRVPLVPCVSPLRIVLWEKRYLRHNPSLRVKEHMYQGALNLYQLASGDEGGDEDVESRFREAEWRWHEAKTGEMPPPSPTVTINTSNSELPAFTLAEAPAGAPTPTPITPTPILPASTPVRSELRTSTLEGSFEGSPLTLESSPTALTATGSIPCTLASGGPAPSSDGAFATSQTCLVHLVERAS